MRAEAETLYNTEVQEDSQLAWHARGHRFDSGILHDKSLIINEVFFIPPSTELQFGYQYKDFGYQMGIKKPKGAVSIENYRGRIRL